MINSCIFDLDGTLLNTLADLRESTNYALKKFDFPVRSTEEIRNFVGNGLRMLIRRAVPNFADEETVDRVLAEMKAHYREHYHDGTVPYDGILPFLRKMKNCGFRMAIVSNKADPMVQLLRTLYFDDLISVAVGELEGVARKPAPDLVEIAMHRLGCTAENAVYIGDSEVDIETAKNAGLPCMSVGWGFRDEEILHNAGAKTIYHSPAELQEALMSYLLTKMSHS
ncbi:MAG: HAD family hydrolase [Faecousia sp.]